LEALLTGNADPVRYAAPDVHITPIARPPFAHMRLQKAVILDDEGPAAHVRVTVAATTADGVELTLTYELGLASRAGRWEVTDLSAAPSHPGASGASRAPATTEMARTPSIPHTAPAAPPADPGA
jgi:hypothetical protein